MVNAVKILLIFSPVILFIIFLLLRKLNLWYWKINERIKLQNEILNELKKLNDK
jgi:hypothetical protein